MRHNQNRRSRGRNRKGPNPLTRSYESNGPDVKVRGTAAHVAEKYMSLARDAVASGDSVSAENYLQHAEHYNRIVMAAQAQFQQSQPQFREGADEGYDDRQANGRPRDRFEYNGDGRGEGETDEAAESAEGDDDRRPARRQDDQGRRGSRSSRSEGADRADRNEAQEASDPAAEPQPEVPAEAAEAQQEAPSQPRRRRRPSKKSESSGSKDATDETKDGAAALAAFPE